jgi:hypothetical protein
MLSAMSNTLATLQARQTLAKMNDLRYEIQGFTQHVRFLTASAKSFDGRDLVEIANKLLQRLGTARLEFQGVEGRVDSLARSLPSRPLAGGGMSPAAQWVPELRAASRQFAETVRDAESALKKLYDKGFEDLNSPTRTPNVLETAFPTKFDSVLDMVLTLADLIERVVEYYKGKPKPKAKK